MLKTIFKIGAISLQLVKFDTQDNLVKTCEATEWSQNVNLDEEKLHDAAYDIDLTMQIYDRVVIKPNEILKDFDLI